MKDFDTYPALVDDLPPLIRKQRRLEARIVLLVPLSEEEKALRKEIDALLVTAGITTSGAGVTCLGYDVCHNERKGHSRLDPDVLLVQLVAAGVDRNLVLRSIAASTEVGDPSTWATVKPSKGAKVRT